MTSHRRERPRPISRIRVNLTFEADTESLKLISGTLPTRKTSENVVTVRISDTSDPAQAVDEVRRAAETIRALPGQSRKEFK